MGRKQSIPARTDNCSYSQVPLNCSKSVMSWAMTAKWTVAMESITMLTEEQNKCIEHIQYGQNATGWAKFNTKNGWPKNRIKEIQRHAYLTKRVLKYCNAKPCEHTMRMCWITTRKKKQSWAEPRTGWKKKKSVWFELDTIQTKRVQKKMQRGNQTST